MEEITYEVILKYLLEDKNIFITKKNNINHNLNNFITILTNNCYRYGINIYDNNNENISFWASLLLILENNYLVNEDFIKIIEYKSQLINMYTKNNLSSFIKKFNKNDIREHINSSIDIITLQYIVDILNINIIIFDFKINEIFTIYKNEAINFTNKTILIANYDLFWEPIITNDKKIFDKDDQIILNIMNENIKYYESDKINKIFAIDNNKNIKTIIYNTNQLNKFTKPKLLELVEIHKNITYSNTNKITKKELIDLLLS
uniref:Uncharacterized protein n=1 Tax=viral metagenome TaxID=1070528 RepID=A0A6C0H952_9ZZZZ